MNIIVFEDAGVWPLLPLTWTRAAFELRCGRRSLLEKHLHALPGRLAEIFTRPLVEPVVRARTRLEPPVPHEPFVLLNSRAILPQHAQPPAIGQAWLRGDTLVAATLPAERVAALSAGDFLEPARLAALTHALDQTAPPADTHLIAHPWDLIHAVERELRRECSDGGVHSATVYPGAHLLNSAAIHLAAGVRIKPGVVLDAEPGPIHIDADVEIQPNAVIEGPCFIGAGTIIRPGAVVRGASCIGPACRVGGEIEASIFQGFANKQHDGFLGHSFVGSWVNLGADTVSSDLKNNYSTIRVAINGVPIDSGRRFLGAMIADHVKTGIGTILPTGAVLGVAANVFTGAPLPKFVPSFAWLTGVRPEPCQVEKVIQTARIAMRRRNVDLSAAEQALLESVARESRQVEAAGWR